MPPDVAPVAGLQPGGLGGRFLARLIDGLIFGIPFEILTVVFDSAAIFDVVGGVLYLTYYVYLESSGQTLGKQIMKLHVYGASGGKPTTNQSFKRNAWYILAIFSPIPILGIVSGLLGLVAVIAIAVTISQDKVARRGWHDKLSNTVVLRSASGPAWWTPTSWPRRRPSSSTT